MDPQSLDVESIVLVFPMGSRPRLAGSAQNTILGAARTHRHLVADVWCSHKWEARRGATGQGSLSAPYWA